MIKSQESDVVVIDSLKTLKTQHMHESYTES